MKFRPCIDIHNGRVKQIVGSSLDGDTASENFVSQNGAEYFARMYKERSLSGGHIILLNPSSSHYYEEDKEQAFRALAEYPQGLQIGGGVNADNAREFLDRGASHVIVTSFVFREGRIDYGNLERLVSAVGSERLVLDLSCKRFGDRYYIVTDRWTMRTDIEVSAQTLGELSKYCDEFLVHAVDNEGKSCGIDRGLAAVLSLSPITVTYAGGIASYNDISELESFGGGRIDFTVGSALDIFGGKLSFEELAARYGR